MFGLPEIGFLSLVLWQWGIWCLAFAASTWIASRVFGR